MMCAFKRTWPATSVAEGVFSTEGAAAYDNFKGAFIIAGGSGMKYRMENSGWDRNFPFGHFESDANGELTAFKGTYVSDRLGGYYFPNASGPEGNTMQNILAGAEAVARQPGDFVRSVPPLDP
jgi:hypothetical protein